MIILYIMTNSLVKVIKSFNFQPFMENILKKNVHLRF